MTNEELVERIQHGINATEYMGQLYIQNKGFIATLIKKYGYAYASSHDSLPIIEKEELMHEAYFGLIEAVKRYDPETGANFLTYASFWISQVVRRFLDNSGQVIRVPVHTQEKIYKYNQVKGYYLRNYNREPLKHEYAALIGISTSVLENLEKFMYQGTIQSLDETVPGGETDVLSFVDVVQADVNVEDDVVDKLAAEQLREELWDIVNQVLKDEKRIRIFRLRFINNLSLEQIGDKFHVCKQAINESIKYGIKILRYNSRTKNLGEELGLWSREIPLDASRVKRWAEDEHMADLLRNKELKYAVNMGWINIDTHKLLQSL